MKRFLILLLFLIVSAVHAANTSFTDVTNIFNAKLNSANVLTNLRTTLTTLQNGLIVSNGSFSVWQSGARQGGMDTSGNISILGTFTGNGSGLTNLSVSGSGIASNGGSGLGITITNLNIGMPLTSNTWIFAESVGTGLNRSPFTLGQIPGVPHGVTTFDEPRSNHVFHLGINTDANGNTINQGMPQFMWHVEPCWQNITNYTQTEYWQSWGPPTNGFGTNSFSGFRFDGWNFVWETQTRNYYDVNHGQLADEFYWGNPRVSNFYPYSMTTTTNGPTFNVAYNGIIGFTGTTNFINIFNGNGQGLITAPDSSVLIGWGTNGGGTAGAYIGGSDTYNRGNLHLGGGKKVTFGDNINNSYQYIIGDTSGNDLTYGSYNSHIWKTDTSGSGAGTQRMKLFGSTGNLVIGGQTTSSNGFTVGNPATYNVDSSGNQTNAGNIQAATLNVTGAMNVVTQNVGTLVLTNVDGSMWTNLAGANINYATNLSTMAPNFALPYSTISTNNVPVFLAPINVNQTLFQTCVIFVTNSTASALAMTAPANFHTQGTWYVTNLSSVTFVHYGNYWSNAISLPLW